MDVSRLSLIEESRELTGSKWRRLQRAETMSWFLRRTMLWFGFAMPFRSLCCFVSICQWSYREIHRVYYAGVVRGDSGEELRPILSLAQQLKHGPYLGRSINLAPKLSRPLRYSSVPKRMSKITIHPSQRFYIFQCVTFFICNMDLIWYISLILIKKKFLKS